MIIQRRRVNLPPLSSLLSALPFLLLIFIHLGAEWVARLGNGFYSEGDHRMKLSHRDCHGCCYARDYASPDPAAQSSPMSSAPNAQLSR